MDTKALRNALGCFGTGITVVTTVTEDGGLVGLTVNSFSSVSLEPPLVLFSLGRSSSSLGALESASHFAVNVLRDDQMALSNRFAFYKGDRWEGIEYALDDAGCPVFEGVLASFHCEVFEILEGGDHRIFMGRVLDFRYDPKGDPLLYYRSRYRGLKASDEEESIDKDIWMSW